MCAGVCRLSRYRTLMRGYVMDQCLLHESFVRPYGCITATTLSHSDSPYLMTAARIA